MSLKLLTFAAVLASTSLPVCAAKITFINKINYKQFSRTFNDLTVMSVSCRNAGDAANNTNCTTTEIPGTSGTVAKDGTITIDTSKYPNLRFTSSYLPENDVNFASIKKDTTFNVTSVNGNIVLEKK